MSGLHILAGRLEVAAAMAEAYLDGVLEKRNWRLCFREFQRVQGMLSGPH